MKEDKKSHNENEAASVEDFLAKNKEAQEVSGKSVQDTRRDKDDQMIKTLKRILEALKRMRNGRLLSDDGFVRQVSRGDLFEMSSSSSSSQQISLMESEAFAVSQSANTLDLRTNNSGGKFSTWIRHTEKSSFVMEQENTTFSSNGVVRTADGREIEFGVSIEMSRGFVGTFHSVEDKAAILTDPLVINLEDNNASVTDQKFFFDLDADGTKEEMSFVGKGSGFLAFDKNGDGTINDGSELFGTKSGDGFSDLAAYDEDGNGWIDENDNIFNKLKVWTKNEDGSDRLIDLKQADVGAIYLGSTDTQFHLNNATTNATNAVIQKTGVFLKESGGVGTMQHVDLAV